MPILIAILVAVGGAILWWARSNPRDALSVADDAITIARNAPRKIAFRRQTKGHPVDGIDDPTLAIIALGEAFIELEDLPTREDRQRLHVLVRQMWRMTEEDAEEAEALARWLVGQCGSPSSAIDRIGRRLAKIDDGTAWSELQPLLASLGEDGLSEGQSSAFDELHQRLTRSDKR
ncbi:hypothetical protein [Jannaschia pohangensis]|uniref:Tellurite resistance protein TerB n=1 Tax=Jannaschia pohangensis TaxID=390807 RepID=A0A1I3M2G9_9RHOB|nr:hypothetical protein [Jannaschia pohangensis]SFI91209.1 hypothetical protein SAMN04488095_1711 [Jannaschia pohangensis]